jgi:hypothetical protein
MSNRQPSTPPPLADESSNPFFTTPQFRSNSRNGELSSNNCNHKRGNSFNNNHINSHTLKHHKKFEKSTSNVLFTPQTPCINNNDDELPSNLLPLSPQTTTKKNNAIIDVFGKQNQPTKIFNPLRTPETTPRHFYRKRDTIELINLEGSSTAMFSKINQPLFPTAQSNIGSGRTLPQLNRKDSSNSQSSRKGLLEFRSSIKINVEEEEEDNEKNEEDINKEKKDSTDVNKVRNSPYFTAKEKELMNYSSSEYDSDEEKNKATNLLQSKINISGSFTKSNSPSTPPNQIITDELIMEKFGIEKCQFDFLEDLNETKLDLQNKYQTNKINNPFIKRSDSFKISKIQKKKATFNPRFENEIEMVYHATGEKFFVQLSDEAKKVKPKKLNFDEFKDLDLDSDIDIESNDLLKTPTLNEHNKMSIRGLLNYDGHNRESNEKIGTILAEGIRKEKIHNPFKTQNNLLDPNLKKGILKQDIHEIEFINQTTGEKIIEKMDDEQLRIRPRKLNFDDC